MRVQCRSRGRVAPSRRAAAPGGCSPRPLRPSASSSESTTSRCRSTPATRRTRRVSAPGAATRKAPPSSLPRRAPGAARERGRVEELDVRQVDHELRGPGARARRRRPPAGSSALCRSSSPWSRTTTVAVVLAQLRRRQAAAAPPCSSVVRGHGGDSTTVAAAARNASPPEPRACLTAWTRPPSPAAPAGRTSRSPRCSSRASCGRICARLYGYCRLVDILGDEVEGDRLAALDELEREVDALLRRRARMARDARAPADDPRVRAAARAVRPADRGEPHGPADLRVRDLGRPEGLLRPLGRPGRAARARPPAARGRRGVRRLRRWSAPGSSS